MKHLISFARIMAAVAAMALHAPAWADSQSAEAQLADAAVTISVPGERSVDLPLAGHVTQRVLYAAPAQPRATLVMLPGGAGDVGLEEDGDVRHDNNFVVRTRALWVARGYAVLIPDALDRANLRGVRSSPQYAALVGELARFAKAQAKVPVFLLGTSQGSIAAMNGAAHTRTGLIAGVILTESVSRMGGSHETVFSAHPEQVRLPALVVANRDDQCNVAPPKDAARIAAAMTSSPDVKIQTVSGGIEKSHKECGSLTPHGYYGIEAQVVDDIARWIDAHIN